MSLNWDLTKIKDYKKVCWNGNEMNPRTNTLIMMTMVIGIGEITEANAPEVFARLSFYETLRGAMMGRTLKRGYKPAPFTFEHVRAHIGLSTNVFPKISEAKFLSNVGGNFLDDQLRMVERELKKEKEAAQPALTA